MTLKLTTLILALISIFYLPKSATATSTTTNILIDSYVSQEFRETNYGSFPSLQLVYGEFNNKYAVFRFHLSSIPEGSIINSAIAKFYFYRFSGTCSLSFIPFNAGWSENTITWNNIPSYSGGVIDNPKLDISQHGFREIDITKMVKDWTSGQKPNNGFIVATMGPNTGKCTIVSRESLDETKRPSLEINYSRPYQIKIPTPTLQQINIPRSTATPTLTPTPTPMPSLTPTITRTPSPTPTQTFVSSTLSPTITPTLTSIPINQALVEVEPENPSENPSITPGPFKENQTNSQDNKTSNTLFSDNSPLVNFKNKLSIFWIIIPAFAVVLTIIFLKKKKAQKANKTTEEIANNLVKDNRSSFFRKKIFFIGLAIVMIIFVLPQLSSLSTFPLPGSSKLPDTKNSPDHYVEYLNSFTEIDYQDPPQNIVSATFDCRNYYLLPNKSKKYLCKNIYQTDENLLKTETLAQQPDRIFLYGENINYDCPGQSSKAKEPIVECYRSAKFIDNWQIKKMREIFGVKFPVKKIYYYLTESLEETQKLCGSRGAEGKQAGACFDSKDYKIISPAYNSNGSIYLGLVTALFFESNNQNEEPIKYKGQLYLPRNCYLTDVHEITHTLNESAWKNMPVWFDEGLVRLLQGTIKKHVCPPGTKVVNFVKVIDNEEIFVSETFDPDSLDWEEPLSQGLAKLSEDSSCRKGIFLEIAKNIRDGGIVFLKSLYRELGQKQNSSENSIAETVWKSTGEDISVKDSLIRHQCSF